MPENKFRIVIAVILGWILFIILFPVTLLAMFVTTGVMRIIEQSGAQSSLAALQELITNSPDLVARFYISLATSILFVFVFIPFIAGYIARRKGLLVGFLIASLLPLLALWDPKTENIGVPQLAMIVIFLTLASIFGYLGEKFYTRRHRKK